MKIPIPADNEHLSPEEEAEILKAMANDAKDAEAKARANRLANDYLRSLPRERAFGVFRAIVTGR